MIKTILPYTLPLDVKAELLELAANSDLLLFGETHGTQEVPRLVLGLLDDLDAIGYVGLGLEIGPGEQTEFAQFASGASEKMPVKFLSPDFRDGRRSLESLSLVQQMLARPAGWELFFFDVDFLQEGETGSDRDRYMAENLLTQWEERCPGQKVIAVCGSYHSRLVAPPEPDFGPWPSFAHTVQQLRPDLTVNSVHIVFHGGSFYNMEIKSFSPGRTPLVGDAELRPGGWLGHTLELHLPSAAPVTFLQDA